MSNLVIHKRKQDGNHGLGPKPRVDENQHKVAQVFVILKLTYTMSGVDLLKTGFLAMIRENQLPITYEPFEF